MQQNTLNTTQKRLTRIFTGVVFCVVFILGMIFLVSKYYNSLRVDTRDFLRSTNDILSFIETTPNFQLRFLQNQGGDNSRLFRDIRRSTRENFFGGVSFFIVDTEGKVQFQNIFEDPNFAEIDDTFGNSVYRDNDMLLRNVILDTNLMGEKIIFYKYVRYSTKDFFEELMFLGILICIFSISFYIVGYFFVKRALEPVKINIQDMVDFIHNAGHELKTPLAVLRGNMQVMGVEKEFDSQLISKNISEIDKINLLIEGLRELAEIGKTTHLESLDIQAEVLSIVDEFSEMINEKNIKLKTTFIRPHRLYTNKQEFHILISNLLKNAIHYSDDEGIIEVTIQKNIFTIRDYGCGISAENQSKIFERFYQVNAARSTDGFGIGLSLVKKIADTNNWKIQLISEVGQGSEFTIIF